MSNKKVLLLFSGGIDSTYLLYKNLLEDNEVYLLHNNITNNREQILKENKAISNIKEWLKNNIKSGIINDIQSRMTFGIGDWFGGEAYTQPYLWITSLALVLQVYNNIDEIQYGLIAKDDGLSYLDDLRTIFDSMMMLPNLEKFKGKLKFPLIKYHKREIMDKLPDSLLKLTTSCAMIYPEKYCNHCESCRTLLNALYPGAGLYKEGYDLNKSIRLNSDEEIQKYIKEKEAEIKVELTEEVKKVEI